MPMCRSMTFSTARNGAREVPDGSVADSFGDCTALVQVPPDDPSGELSLRGTHRYRSVDARERSA